MIEIEVQNESHQTEHRVRFAAVPRIGEGIRLREPDGLWASYDVLDVWYQKAEYGDIWMPYLHVCLTPVAGRKSEFDRPHSTDEHPENAGDEAYSEDVFADDMSDEGAFASLVRGS